MKYLFWITVFLLSWDHASFAALGVVSPALSSPPLAEGATKPIDFDTISPGPSDPEIQPQWSLDRFSDVSASFQSLGKGQKTGLIRSLMRPLLIAGADGPQGQPEPAAFLHQRLSLLMALGFVEDAQTLLQKIPKEQRPPVLHEDAVMLMLLQNRRVEACAYGDSIPAISAKIRAFCLVSIQDTDKAQLLMDLEAEYNPSAAQDPFWMLLRQILDDVPPSVEVTDPLSIMLALYQKKPFAVSSFSPMAVPFYAWIANASFMPISTRIAAAEATLAADIFSPAMVRSLYDAHPAFKAEALAQPKATLKTLDSGSKGAFLWQWSKKNPSRLSTLMRLLPETGLSPQILAVLFEPVLQNTPALNDAKPSAALIASLLYLGDQEQAKSLWDQLTQQALNQSLDAKSELLKTWGYDVLFDLSPHSSGHSSGWHTLIHKMWEKTVYAHQVAVLDYLTGRAKAPPSSVTTGLDMTKLCLSLQNLKESPSTRLTLGKYFSMIKSYAPEQKFSFALAVYAP
jgi:hypothetical protein